MIPSSYSLIKTLFKAVSQLFDYNILISGVTFIINQQVEVTESYIPEFSVSTFLGGSLGLWLGVGVVQLLNLGVAILFRI